MTCLKYRSSEAVNCPASSSFGGSGTDQLGADHECILYVKCVCIYPVHGIKRTIKAVEVGAILAVDHTAETEILCEGN
jgi:hypothetical protein